MKRRGERRWEEEEDKEEEERKEEEGEDEEGGVIQRKGWLFKERLRVTMQVAVAILFQNTLFNCTVSNQLSN